MTDTSLEAFLKLVSGTRGHFLLESGLHGGLWLDLDPLFDNRTAVAPFIHSLAEKIRPYDPEIVCGPQLGGGVLAERVAEILGSDFCVTERVNPNQSAGLFTAQYVLTSDARERVKTKRVAIVDDVMSAGSSLRATLSELRTNGATVVVAGALLILGNKGTDHFQKENIPVESTNRDAYDFYEPSNCPMCKAGTPLERR